MIGLKKMYIGYGQGCERLYCMISRVDRVGMQSMFPIDLVLIHPSRVPSDTLKREDGGLA